MIHKRGKPPKQGSVPIKTSQEITRLKKLLEGQWLQAIVALAPGFEDAAENFPQHVPCPVHGGKDGFRFFNDAEITGGGICNTCGNFPDGIALLRWANNWDLRATIQALYRYLGVDPPHLPPKPKRVIIDPAAQREKNLQAKKRIDRILDETVPDTNNRIFNYFKSRGLNGKIPPDIRYHPGLPYYNEKHEIIGEFETMIAPIRQLDGTIVSLLLTYLDHEGPGKATVKPEKKIIPALWKGATMGAAIHLDTPGETLCIAEGIETGLASAVAVKYPVWAATSAGALEKIEIPACTKKVIIMADNDKNGRGQKAADIACDRLLKKNLMVKVVIPDKEGKDWLDILNEEGKKAICKSIEEADWYDGFEEPDTPGNKGQKDGQLHPEDPGESTQNADIIDLNKNHFIIDMNGKICIGNEARDPQTGVPNITLSTVADLRLRYANHFLSNDDSIANAWLRSDTRREYQGLIFSPEGDIPGFYNLFSGFAVEPEPGDCRLYWDHVKNNICNANTTHYDFVRKWMSHAIQRPGELPGTALVIQGLQGTGKGIFTEYFGTLFGQHYLTLYSLTQLTGRFNSHLKNILLVHANEAIWGGNKASEGVLKGIITDPSTPIEFKGRDIISVRNYKRLIVATNENWAVPLGMDDRRFLVLEVNPGFKEDKTYFGAIVEQMKNGGLQALMYDLMTEDLEGFDVRTTPYSQYAFNIKMRGATPIQQWWYEKLTESEPENWQTDPVKQELYGDYLCWCKSQGLRPEAPATFGKTFLDFFPGRIVLNGSRRLKRVIERDDMNQCARFVSKRVRCYNLPSLEQCRICFQVFSKSGSEIWSQGLEKDKP